MVGVLAGQRRPAGNPATFSATTQGGVQAPPQRGGGVIPFRRAAMRKQNIQGTLVYAAGASIQPWQLVSQGYLESLQLLAIFTSTAGTGTGPNQDTPWAYIRRMRLVDSGNSTVYSLSGYSSFIHSKFMMGHRAWVDQSTDTAVMGTLTGVGTQTNQPFLWEVPIANNDRDLIGLLPNQSDAYKFFLSVDWESIANLWSTPGTATLSGTVTPHYRYLTIPQPTGPGGMAQQVEPDLYGVVHQVIDITTNGPNASSPANWRLNLDTGKVYRAVALIIRDAGAGTLRQNEISAIRLKYGDDVTVWAASGQELRAEQFLRNGRDCPAGVYILDFMSDSGLWIGDDYRRDYLDSRDLSQLWFEIDWTGVVGQVTITILEDLFLVPAGIAI